MTAAHAVVVAYAIGLAILSGYAAALAFMTASVARRERRMDRRSGKRDEPAG